MMKTIDRKQWSKPADLTTWRFDPFYVGPDHLQRGHQRVREGPTATTGIRSVGRDAARSPLARCGQIRRSHQCVRVVSAAAASVATVAGGKAPWPRATKNQIVGYGVFMVRCSTGTSCLLTSVLSIQNYQSHRAKKLFEEIRPHGRLS